MNDITRFLGVSGTGKLNQLLTEIESECKKAGGRVNRKSLQHMTAEEFLATLILNKIKISVKYNPK